MAQLRRAVKDGHLFILAGPSQGTWQVGEKGEQWLLQNHYPIPAENEYVDIDAGTFSYLKDKGFLYIYGIQYEQWLTRAQKRAGSWWEDWRDWLGQRSGEQKAAPEALGNEQYQPGTPAPGSYVFEP